MQRKARVDPGGAARRLLAAASLAADPAPAPAPAAAAPRPGSRRSLSHSDAGLNVTYFWSKGAKLRAETVIAGRRITTLVSGNTYYAYDAVGAERCRDHPQPEGDRRGRSRSSGRSGASSRTWRRQGAERVRDEEVMGRACEVFRLTDQLGRRELWVTKDKLRLPVRVVVYRRDTGRTHDHRVRQLAHRALDRGRLLRARIRASRSNASTSIPT